MPPVRNKRARYQAYADRANEALAGYKEALAEAGLLDGLYREARVESVEYAATIDVVAVCPPKVLGQVKDYVEGWHEEKEDWEL